MYVTQMYVRSYIIMYVLNTIKDIFTSVNFRKTLGFCLRRKICLAKVHNPPTNLLYSASCDLIIQSVAQYTDYWIMINTPLLLLLQVTVEHVHVL